MLNSSLTSFLKVQSDFKFDSKLVTKVKYPFKRRTDILRFLYLFGEQNVLRHFASVSVSSYCIFNFSFLVPGWWLRVQVWG